MLAIALALSASVALVQDPGPAVVWGQVRSHATGTALRFAVIEVVTGGRRAIQTVTDSTGLYALQNVPPGRRVIRATHFDHAPHEIEVSVATGQQRYIDFELELRPVKLPEVNARTTAQNGLRDTVATTPPELGKAAVHVLEVATPGVGEFGLTEVAEVDVGQDPPDPSDVLFVRGTAADLKLVLLNGAPVYAPFHIGGLINALEIEMLRSATLYLGGAPAKYDGGLSYVMDLETRAGRTNEAHADIELDVLAGRAMAEGPIGSAASYLVGGRAVHGLGTTPFVADPFPYEYGDALARFDIELGRFSGLSLTGFWNRETVRLDSANIVDQIAGWGNEAGSLRYWGEIAGSNALVTVAAGTFRTELPLGGARALVTKGSSKRVRVAADFDRPVGPARLFYGGSFDHLRFERHAVHDVDSVTTPPVPAGDQGNVTGLYVETGLNLATRVRLRGGIRADMFSISPRPRLAPRLSVTALIAERAAVTLAGGRYHQYVRVPGSLDIAGTVEADIEQARQFTVARATHMVMALEQDLGEGMGLAIEAFYKAFDGLPAASPENTGGETAKASGLDLWVRRSEGKVTGWFGYSLAWAWSDEADESNARTPTPYSGRHLVSAGLSGPMIGGGTFDVRVAYGAGLPFTAIPEPEVTTPVFAVGHEFQPAATLASEPEPTLPSAPSERYLRLDAQLARTWAGNWRGLAFELTPYLKVLNALDRRDAIFYHYQRNDPDPEPRALAGLPVLPIVGLRWTF